MAAVAPLFDEGLRVSSFTGRVVQRWAMPMITRALLAVDGDGLGLAPGFASGEPEHTPASQLPLYQSLYRVSAGMRAPTRVFVIGPAGAEWMVASGHSAWVDSNRRVALAWRVDGAGTQRVIRVSLGSNELRTVASVEAAGTSVYSTPPPAVGLRGAFYFLNAGGRGPGTLVRVRPRGS